jgi:hypothetical protein
MKEVPCKRCGRAALGPPTQANPGGEPIRFGRFTGGARPIILKCFRCGDSFKLDALAFNALPNVVEKS